MVRRATCDIKVAANARELVVKIRIQRLSQSLLLALLVSIVPVIASAEPSQTSASPKTSVVGKSYEGRPIECIVHGDGPDVLMIIATIHGNEAAGTPLVAAFSEWLIEHPAKLSGRQVVIVPVANPDGFAAGERFNSRGVDLNRNFPAGNWREEKVTLHGSAPLSEPESRVLMQLVCRYFPNRLISIHQPLECVDYDGPGERLAEVIAAKCPLSVKKLGGRPGSFGSFVGETLGKPIITLELPKAAGMDADVLWRTYGESLIAALSFEVDSAGK